MPADPTRAPTPRAPRLRRPRRGRMIAGVCAGIAERTDLSVRQVRLLAVLSCLLPGPQFVGYLILWAVIPAGDD